MNVVGDRIAVLVGDVHKSYVTFSKYFNLCFNFFMWIFKLYWEISGAKKSCFYSRHLI